MLVAQAYTAPPHAIIDLLEPIDTWTRRLSSAGSVALSLVLRAAGKLLAAAYAPITGASDAVRVASVLRTRLDGALRRIVADVLQSSPEAPLAPVHLAPLPRPLAAAWQQARSRSQSRRLLHCRPS
jgi:hypothetical protein